MENSNLILWYISSIMAPLNKTKGAHIMLKDELIKAITETIGKMDVRELDLIYRMIKGLIQ